MRTIIDPKEFVDLMFERFPLIYRLADEQIGVNQNTRIVRYRDGDRYGWKYFYPNEWENTDESNGEIYTETRGPLYRYLMAIIMTAGAETLGSAERLWHAQDPQGSPDRLFVDWYENFGLPYLNDIPIWFQRKVLSILGELYTRKGTRGAIEYLAQEVTGFGAEIVDLKYNNFRTWSPYAPFVLHHKPSILNATLKSPDNIHRLAAFDPSNAGRGRVREVQLTLTAPFDEATTRVRERVLRRFLRYFMPFDVRWTILTRWFFEDVWEVSGSRCSCWDLITTHDQDSHEAVTSYAYLSHFESHDQEHFKIRVHQAAVTNDVRFRLNGNWKLSLGQDTVTTVTDHLKTGGGGDILR